MFPLFLAKLISHDNVITECMRCDMRYVICDMMGGVSRCRYKSEFDVFMQYLQILFQQSFGAFFEILIFVFDQIVEEIFEVVC